MYKFSPADVDQESGLGYIAGPAVDGWDIPVELGMDASILAKSGKTRQFAGRFGLSAPPKTFGYRPSPIGGMCPVGNDPDERSPMAKAAGWAARILTVAAEMVLPALGGTWIDRKLGTVAVFMLIGLGLGCFSATLHLMQMIKKID